MGSDVQTISAFSKMVKHSKAIINVSEHMVSSQERLQQILSRIESIEVPSCFDITWETEPDKISKRSWSECVGSCVKCIISLKHLSQEDRVRSILLCLHLLPYCLESKFAVNREIGSCVALIALKVFGKTMEESSQQQQQKIQNFIIKVGCHKSAQSIRQLFDEVELALLQSLADLDVRASLLCPILCQFQYLQVRVSDSKDSERRQIQILAAILSKSISSVIYIYECEEFARAFLSYHNKLEFNSELVAITLRTIVRHLNQQTSKHSNNTATGELIQSQKSYLKMEAMIHQVLNSQHMNQYPL